MNDVKAVSSRLRALCADLAEEPMLAASLGSRELFHSNLLGWMCDRFPDQAIEVLSPWLTPAPGASGAAAQREFHNFDLVVRLPGFTPVVIENKVFSLPDEEQLDRYTPDVAKHVSPEATLVLLSLMDAGWPDGRHTAPSGQVWRAVRWRDVAERMGAVFTRLGSTAHAPSGPAGDDFDRLMLLHWVRLLRLLDDVCGLAGADHEQSPYVMPDAWVDILRAVRLADAVGKARAQQMMGRIRREYRRRGIPVRGSKVGFSNGSTLLGSLRLDHEGTGVGWQLQGRDWRVAMIVGRPGLKGKGLHPARAKFADRHPGWFDFEPLLRVLDVTDDQVRAAGARIAPDGYNRYDPDMVYRYRRLPADTTVGQVVDLAVAYGLAAQHWRLS